MAYSLRLPFIVVFLCCLVYLINDQYGGIEAERFDAKVFATLIFIVAFLAVYMFFAQYTLLKTVAGRASLSLRQFAALPKKERMRLIHEHLSTGA